MIITEHAARRYVKRIAPNITVDQARKHLRNAAASATLLPDRTFKGQQLWQTKGCHDAILVVKHDPACGLVAVTVIRIGDITRAEQEVEHVVLSAFERAEKARESAAGQPKPETWREKYDRLNRETEANEKRRAERAVRREEQKTLDKAAKERRAAKTKARLARTAERAAAKHKAAVAKRFGRPVPT